MQTCLLTGNLQSSSPDPNCTNQYQITPSNQSPFYALLLGCWRDLFFQLSTFLVTEDTQHGFCSLNHYLCTSYIGHPVCHWYEPVRPPQRTVVPVVDFSATFEPVSHHDFINLMQLSNRPIISTDCWPRTFMVNWEHVSTTTAYQMSIPFMWEFHKVLLLHCVSLITMCRTILSQLSSFHPMLITLQPQHLHQTTR